MLLSFNLFVFVCFQTVLLVFEYNVTTEADLDQKSTKKPNWIGLFNDSTAFDAKYNKAKLNIDPNTLKLLPIILKALNHNRYLEKLIEDSSSSPVYERKDTTEFSFKKNIFTDSKNWMRNPGTRNNLEIDHFKLPSSNLDYYSKNRKIRDYQRILNYFDKMISDKVNIGANQPVHIVTPTEKPLPISKSVKIKKEADNANLKMQTNKAEPTKIQIIKSEGCKCSKKLGLLLSKLMTNIQDLIPEIMIAKSPCNAKRIDDVQKDNAIITTTSKPLSPTKLTFSRLVKKSTTAIKKASSSREKARVTVFKKEVKKRIDPVQTSEQGSNEIENVNLDFIKKFYNKNYKLSTITTSKGYLEATKAFYIKEATTIPMQKNRKTVIKNQISAEEDYTTEDATTVLYGTKKSRTMSNNKAVHNDDTSTTNEYKFNDFNQIRFQDLQLNTKKPLKVAGNKQTRNKFDLVKFINKAMESELFHLNKAIIPTSFSLVKTKGTSTPKAKIELDSSLRPETGYESSAVIRKNYSGKTSIKRYKDQTTVPSQNSNTTKIRENFNEDEENKTSEDDIQEEESMKQIETLNNHIRPSLKYDNDKAVNYSSLLYGPVTIKYTNDSDIILQIEETNPRQLKSMLPMSRPMYLEINRNNFKQDTADDYNANVMDTNIFDLY